MDPTKGKHIIGLYFTRIISKYSSYIMDVHCVVIIGKEASTQSMVSLMYKGGFEINDRAPNKPMNQCIFLNTSPSRLEEG